MLHCVDILLGLDIVSLCYNVATVGLHCTCNAATIIQGNQSNHSRSHTTKYSGHLGVTLKSGPQ